MIEVGAKITIDAAAGAQTVGELKKAIKDLTSEAIKAGAAGDSNLRKAYVKAAGEAKDKLQELNREITIAGDSANKLKALQGIGMGIAQGFQAAQAAANLFGGAGKDVEEQILKIQSIMALTQGITGIMEGVKSVKLLSNVFGAAKTAATAFGISAEAAEAAATAGITLLIGGVTLLIANFDKLGALTGKVGGQIIKLIEKQHQYATATEGAFVNATASIENQTKKIKEQNDAWAKSAEEQKQLEDEIAKQKLSDEEEIKKSMMSTFELQKYELQKQKEQYLADQVDSLEVEKWYQSELTKIQVEEEKERQKQLADAKSAAQKDPEIKTGEAPTSAQDLFQAELKLEREKYAAKLKIAQEYSDALLSLNDLVTNIQLKNAHGNAAREEQIRRQSFERSKKVQEALAIIHGLQGIQAVLAGAANKELGPIGIALDAAEIASIIATTAANVSKIKSTTYEGGGASGGATPSLTSASSGVNLSSLQQQSTLLSEAEAQGQQQSVPQRVYVVESDITNSQNKVRVIQDRGLIH